MLRLSRFWVLLPLLLAVIACNAPLALTGVEPTPAPSPTATPEPPAQPTTPPPTSTPLPPPTPNETLIWRPVMPGMEIRISSIATGNGPAEVTMVRVDPLLFDFRVHYAPEAPQQVSGWHRTLGAALTVNGGFFLPDNTTLGLIVEEGQRYGTPFDRYGGMLRIYAEGLELRSMAQVPYDPAEPIDWAVQGNPMLLYPGGFPVEFDLPAEGSRRTVVAQDAEGRVIFLAIDWGAVTLYNLRDWLAQSTVPEFFVALNLDGGGSTGMALTAGDDALLIESFFNVPSVIAVYPREE